MKTVQMTLEDVLVKSVDLAVKKLHTTRSAFTRLALKEALRNLKTKQLEYQHRQGYLAHPATREKAGVWEKEQAWGDE
jgi:metal-responsive CopG/Arc/MetJ family transcriptional regulator